MAVEQLGGRKPPRPRVDRGWGIGTFHLPESVYEFEVMEAEVTGPNTIEATLRIAAGPFEGHRLRTFMHAPFYGLAEAAGDELETGPSARHLVGQRFHAHLNDRIPAIIPETVKLSGPAKA